MTAAPLVHVVVVDYDGGELTLASLRSLVATEWPPDRLRIVLVDNASRSPVVASVVQQWPQVEIVTSPVNLGFAGGCNIGLQRRGNADFVALVNNDAAVSPDWLAPLVAATHESGRIGAACPKILLADEAVDITLDLATRRRGRGDHRDLGVRLSGARFGARDAWDRIQLVDGFWGFEPMPPGEAGGQWTAGHAHLRLPVEAGDPTRPEMRLAADAPTEVTVTSGADSAILTVVTKPGWFRVPFGAAPVTVINNVGTVVGPDGYAADRGWLEVDDGQFDTADDVAAWCGAAVLLTRDYLDDVGELDERLFLYYEDVEMSQRGAERGWRYRYVPESVVRHVHSATSIERSPVSSHYNERNRLLVLATKASARDAVVGYAHYGAITASYARRDVVSPVLRGERPRPEIVTQRLRALGAAVVRAPRMRRPAPRPPASPDPDATPESPR